MAVQNPYNAQNKQITTAGGVSSSLNLTAGAHLIKAGKGRIMRIVVNTAGSAGTFSVNDVATTGGVAAANAIYTGLNTVAAQTVIDLQFPYQNGLVVTVPTSAVMAVSYV